MGLTEVPRELFLMTEVKELRLGNNELRSLPSEIGRLTKLKILIV
jgi:Leucine-rich repeat (LRR) protein